MRLMDIAALVPQPNTSAPRKENPKFPYLLRQLAIVRPNQVWASDITYIPTKKGFCYLVAVMDWYSRRVLSWRISNTLDTTFCLEAVKEALLKFGCPCIFNTDQGSQFTDTTFTELLLGRGIKVSMDGKGRFMDNIFVERLWRSHPLRHAPGIHAHNCMAVIGKSRSHAAKQMWTWARTSPPLP